MSASLFRIIVSAKTWLLAVLCAIVVRAETPRFRIYIDADRTGCREAGLAIERGVRTALDETRAAHPGTTLDVVVLDHRGNSRRSRRHLEEFLRDERALAVVAGLHSPPLLSNLEFINSNGILVLDPWAAAAPITRPAGRENWVFRLSVDDSKAGRFLAERARRLGYRRPHLLLEKTGWGESNLRTMSSAVVELLRITPSVTWFNWGLEEHSAKAMLRKIKASGADVIFLVANAPEAKPIARAMLTLPREERLPILSHWGITGDDFAAGIGPVLGELELRIIQTRVPFLDGPLPERAKRVFERAKALFSDVEEPADLRPASGFVHAYDLTMLLVAAIRQAGLDRDEPIASARRRVRLALENLDVSVPGLLRTYERPFRVWNRRRPDAHEALSPDDYVLARYLPDGCIALEDSPEPHSHDRHTQASDTDD